MSPPSTVPSTPSAQVLAGSPPVREVAASAAPSAAPSDSGLTSSTAFQVGMSAAAILIASIIVALAYVWKRRRQAAAAAATGGVHARGNAHSDADDAEATRSSGNGAYSADTLLTTARHEDETARCSWVPRKAAPSHPDDDSKAARLKFICQQLDCFNQAVPFAGRYQILGSSRRKKGGVSLLYPTPCRLPLPAECLFLCFHRTATERDASPLTKP